jgi:hypothetical protein
VSAQHVITNPGKCAQFYPNANCQNYGRGNPYTSYGCGERDIVPTGAIVITAAIGADASRRDELGVNSESRREQSVSSIAGWGDASGALAGVAGDLWQGKGESIGQPTSPRLRQHR